jgi:hypothetical protein
MSQSIEFNSMDCKVSSHPICIGRWRGLGIEVICNWCCCKHNQNQSQLNDDSSDDNYTLL